MCIGQLLPRDPNFPFSLPMALMGKTFPMKSKKTTIGEMEDRVKRLTEFFIVVSLQNHSVKSIQSTRANTAHGKHQIPCSGHPKDM